MNNDYSTFPIIPKDILLLKRDKTLNLANQFSTPSKQNARMFHQYLQHLQNTTVHLIGGPGTALETATEIWQDK